jgi:hypothetical protein
MSDRRIVLTLAWWWALAVLTGMALFGSSDSSSQPSDHQQESNDGNEHRARTPTEVVMLRGAPYCNPDCIGLAAPNELIPDGLLRRAASVAYAPILELRPLGRAAVVWNTRIVWGNLPADVGGNYSPSVSLITISTSPRFESTAVLAAVISHELAHVGQPAGRDAATCIEKEMAAFAWQAATWARLPRTNERSAMASCYTRLRPPGGEGRCATVSSHGACTSAIDSVACCPSTERPKGGSR